MEIARELSDEARYATISKFFEHGRRPFSVEFQHAEYLEIPTPHSPKPVSLCQNPVSAGNRYRRNSHFEFRFEWVVVLVLSSVAGLWELRRNEYLQTHKYHLWHHMNWLDMSRRATSKQGELQSLEILSRHQPRHTCIANPCRNSHFQRFHNFPQGKKHEPQQID